MSVSRNRRLSQLVVSTLLPPILAAVGAVVSTGDCPLVAGVDATAAAEDEESERALAEFGRGQKIDSPLWWFARAEEEAGRWGNPFQQADALAEIAKVLADGDQIEAAVAVAKRIDHGPALLGARHRIAAAYARAGKLQKAEGLAMLPARPDGRLEADGYVEVRCHTAVALAKTGRIDAAEKAAAALGQRPAEWPGPWKAPGNLQAARAVIYAAIAAAEAKAGRREAYRKGIEKAETLAGGIPGDINKMWAELGSSIARPVDDGGPNPINAIYKSKAISSVMLARAEAGDYEGARKTLATIGPGRHQDARARELIEVLVDAGRLKAARAVADAIQTDDHRQLAYVSIVGGIARAGDLQGAKALAEKVIDPDKWAVAQTHLAAAAARAGKDVDYEAIVRIAGSHAGLEAASKEFWERAAASGKPPAPRPVRPGAGLRAKTYRELARIQADARSRKDLLGWIRRLPGAADRFYAYLGVGGRMLASRSAGTGRVIELGFSENGPFARGAIDLDSGTAFWRPKGRLWSTKEGKAWARKNGVDAEVVKLDLRSAARDAHLVKLWFQCTEMVVIPANKHWWDGKPSEIIAEAGKAKPEPTAQMTADAGLPATFLFKTSEGSIGVLQIVEVVKEVDSQQLKIRYKLVKPGRALPASPPPPGR